MKRSEVKTTTMMLTRRSAIGSLVAAMTIAGVSPGPDRKLDRSKATEDYQ